MSATKKKKSSAAGAVPLADELQECNEILKALEAKDNVEAFMEPVDWKALQLPDYPEVVKFPMDLGTIRVRRVRFSGMRLLAVC